MVEALVVRIHCHSSYLGLEEGIHASMEALYVLEVVARQMQMGLGFQVAYQVVAVGPLAQARRMVVPSELRALRTFAAVAEVEVVAVLPEMKATVEWIVIGS